jgi:hypothetical protein
MSLCGSDLIAPDVLVTELATQCTRRAAMQHLSAEAQSTTQRLLLEVLPRLMPSNELVEPATRLATLRGRPVAETMHLALALQEQATYVTADQWTFRALAPTFPCVRYLDDIAGDLKGRE